MQNGSEGYGKGIILEVMQMRVCILFTISNIFFSYFLS